MKQPRLDGWMIASEGWPKGRPSFFWGRIMVRPMKEGTRARWLRRWYIWAGVLVFALLVTAFLFPYLLKRYIEAHSEEWIARKVTIGSIVLNPFSGVYAVKDFTCYEPQSDQVFISFQKLGVKADLWSGYRTGNWRFWQAELRDPTIRVVQDHERFNFSDLLELGASEETAPAQASTEARFEVVDLVISGGRIDYSSDVLNQPVGIRDLNVSCTRISSAQAVMRFAVGFGLVRGGAVDGGFTINTEQGNYAVEARLRAFALAQLLPYLQDFMDCSLLRGEADLDLAVTDSYSDSSDLALSAALNIRNLQLNGPDSASLLRVAKLRAELDTLLAAQQRFEVGEVLMDGADVRFVLLNNGQDNWTRLLKLASDSAENGYGAPVASESNVFVMLADYISYLGAQFVASEYSARSVELTHCAVHFEDYTPRMPFRYDITELALAANSVSSDQEAGRITTTAVLNGAGQLTGTAVFDPGDLRNVTVDLGVEGLRLAPFDPYSRWYAAHPLESGLLNYRTRTAIQGGTIDSKNALLIDRLKFGKKTTDHDTGIYVLPLRLAAGLLKDAKGLVELDVPVEGDLEDPSFRVWPIVWQVLKNLIVKAATAPAKLLMRAVGGTDARALEEVRFEYVQAVPANEQWKTLDQLARALKAKPELRADLVPVLDRRAEEQETALFMAKRRFLFAAAEALTTADSLRIRELPNSDSAFVAFVEAATPNGAGRSLQDRCSDLVGPRAVTALQADIEYARREHVMQYLLGKGVPPSQVTYREGTPEETAGFIGQPGYRFVYDAQEGTEP